MRNQALIGYLLHQRPYQEKRALYYLFSEEYGVIHGIGKKGAPLFEQLQLFATGKRDLKTFSQINLAQSECVLQNAAPLRYQQIRGQQQYAALYLNEILWKLLPTEDPMPTLWQHYKNSLHQLKQPLTDIEMRLCLRQFEQHLFSELGFALNLIHDSTSASIEYDGSYRFLPDVGLVPFIADNYLENTNVQIVFSGNEIQSMSNLGITESTLNAWSRLYRQLIAHLLDHQPLQSRLLWQQQQRYQ